MTRFVGCMALAAMVLAACSGAPTATSPEASVPPSVVPTNAPTPTTTAVEWTLVAFGDSVTTAGRDTGDSYPLLLARMIESQYGVEVTVQSATADTTSDALRYLGPDGILARLVPDADIITVTVGANEADFGEHVPDGTCRVGAARTECLDRANPDLAANFEAMLTAIDKLRAGKPLALLVTSPDYNPFIGWSGAPSPRFGLDFYRQLVVQEAEVACAAAVRHGGRCLNLTLLFNGPDASDDAAAFLESDHLHPSLAGRQAIADALLGLGLAPLR